LFGDVKESVKSKQWCFGLEIGPFFMLNEVTSPNWEGNIIQKIGVNHEAQEQ
jgi:hypothetical protein